MIIVAWLIAVFMVYLGTVVGKSLTFILYVLGTDFLGALPGDSSSNILLVPMLILFGLLFGRLSASESRGVSKGLQSCFLAGMTVGVTRIFPIPQQGVRWEMDWVLDFAVRMQSHEWALLAMAVGVMTYHTVWGEF